MLPSLPERLTTPEMRTGLFYAAMYLPIGVSTLLLPVWLDGRGIGEEEIGIISATPIFIMIVLNLLVGRVADKASDWRGVIVAGSLVSAVVSLGFVFVDAFWGILLFNTLLVIPIMAIEPVIDAAAIRMTRRRGTDFARVRIWGTFGYIGGTALAGWMFGWVGIAVFVPLLIATALLRGLSALPLPFFRSQNGGGQAGAPLVSAPGAGQTLRQVVRPWFVLTLLGAAILQASHMLLVSFGALLWLRAGVPEAAVGILWIVAPVCEIVTMLFFSHFARRFSARHLLLAACVSGVLRWIGMAYATDVWQLVLLQALHMMTFGLAYMGIVTFIANWTSEEIAAQAQSFYVVMKQICSVVALLFFGTLVAHFGLQSFWAAGLLSAIGAGMILISLSIWSTKAQNESRPLSQ